MSIKGKYKNFEEILSGLIKKVIDNKLNQTVIDRFKIIDQQISNIHADPFNYQIRQIDPYHNPIKYVGDENTEALKNKELKKRKSKDQPKNLNESIDQEPTGANSFLNNNTDEQAIKTDWEKSSFNQVLAENQYFTNNIIINPNSNMMNDGQTIEKTETGFGKLEDLSAKEDTKWVSWQEGDVEQNQDNTNQNKLFKQTINKTMREQKRNEFKREKQLAKYNLDKDLRLISDKQPESFNQINNSDNDIQNYNNDNNNRISNPVSYAEVDKNIKPIIIDDSWGDAINPNQKMDDGLIPMPKKQGLQETKEIFIKANISISDSDLKEFWIHNSDGSGITEAKLYDEIKYSFKKNINIE